ncbi:hypothetical protein [Martelella mediterranea]|uniref:Protease inhibitor Inh n=1 Tax=Martelella mediterranea TaxID=293089 RepID=A0A4R3NIB9_9HYPH|nr:hypothetical protein [Martelella mediterranea]TCT34723.1 hypothetical protein EDC90_10317 [Martelella mediterranea]
MTRSHISSLNPLMKTLLSGLVLAGIAGCSPSTSPAPAPVSNSAPAQEKELPDSIVGKWKMYPAIGPTTRSCSVEFKASAFDQHKGRVSAFACNQVEGLGSINGVSQINGWERKGRTIILSGIAQPNIGTIDLPIDSFSDRVYGSTKDDIRFVIVRQ